MINPPQSLTVGRDQEVCAYFLVFVGCALLAQRCFDACGIYRRQAFLLLLAGLAPWLASAIELVFLPKALPISLSPFAFSIIMGLVLAFGLLRHRLFDLAPMARGLILEQMRDGVVVVDAQGWIVDANPAAQRLLSAPVNETIGTPAARTFRLWPTLSGQLHGNGRAVDAPLLRLDEQERHFEVRTNPLRDAQEHLLAWLISLRDVIEQRKAELAREQSLRELQDALAEVKTLKGLLPICAGCKRIRDDRGYWNQIEHYLSTHAEVRFTHSLCPECIKKYYGDDYATA